MGLGLWRNITVRDKVPVFQDLTSTAGHDQTGTHTCPDIVPIGNLGFVRYSFETMETSPSRYQGTA